jgi:hypothetical protein
MNISSSHTREAGRALRWGSVGIGAIDPRSDGQELEARRDQTAPEHFLGFGIFFLHLSVPKVYRMRCVLLCPPLSPSTTIFEGIS